MQPWLLFYYTGVYEENKYFHGVIHHHVAFLFIHHAIMLWMAVLRKKRDIFHF